VRSAGRTARRLLMAVAKDVVCDTAGAGAAKVSTVY